MKKSGPSPTRCIIEWSDVPKGLEESGQIGLAYLFAQEYEILSAHRDVVRRPAEVVPFVVATEETARKIIKALGQPESHSEPWFDMVWHNEPIRLRIAYHGTRDLGKNVENFVPCLIVSSMVPCQNGFEQVNFVFARAWNGSWMPLAAKGRLSAVVVVYYDKWASIDPVFIIEALRPHFQG
jgi:hypothetical protein